MGLSHAAMARLIDPNAAIDIYEPNFGARLFINFISGAPVRAVSSINSFDAYTHAIIASPPKYHKLNYEALKKDGFNGKVFVEKPVMLPSVSGEPQFQSGYVLRHNYFVRKILDAIARDEIKTVAVVLKTNQDFDSAAENRRMKQAFAGQGLLNEFGSHCINLALAVCGPLGISRVENNRGKVVMAGRSDRGSDVCITLLSSCTDVRKSVFELEVETGTGVYTSDMYSFKHESSDGDSFEESSLASEGVNARAYLRGIDFSVQMATFIEGEYDSDDITHGLMSDVILANAERIISNA